MKSNLLKAVRSLPIACLLLTVALSGCTVKFVADYDAKTEEQMFAAAKRVDTFYGKLLEVQEDKREYSMFSGDYIAIEADLNSLVLRNKVRELNEDSIKISETILKLWIKYKEKHKKKRLYPTGTAKLDRDRFERLFSYAARAEGAKKATGSE